MFEAAELMPTRLTIQRAAALLKVIGDAALLFCGFVATKFELAFNVGDRQA
jgi:hypothetical protein